MNISLPDTLKSFVDEQVAQGSYGTISEYVRELIRKDQYRLQLRDLLLAGAAAALGFINALEQAYTHIGRLRLPGLPATPPTS